MHQGLEDSTYFSIQRDSNFILRTTEGRFRPLAKPAQMVHAKKPVLGSWYLSFKGCPTFQMDRPALCTIFCQTKDYELAVLSASAAGGGSNCSCGNSTKSLYEFQPLKQVGWGKCATESEKHSRVFNTRIYYHEERKGPPSCQVRGHCEKRPSKIP